MSATADIYDTLAKHLKDSQTFSPALRIAYPGRGFKPIGKETYLRADFLPNETTSTSVGAGRDRHIGFFQVLVVFVQADAGIGDFLEIAESVAAQFAKGTMLPTAEKRIVKIPRSPWVSPVIPDSDRPMIPVTIPYECGADTN